MNNKSVPTLCRNWSRVIARSFVCFTLTAVLSAQAFAKDKSAAQPALSLRPPAVPLVACDPYFSIWSPADKLTDTDTVHWTGKENALRARIRIDGSAFGIVGRTGVPALPQKSVEVLPTRTVYTFEGQGIRLGLTFMTPALPDDLEILSRPVTYIAWDVRSIDGKEHAVSFADLEVSPNITVNDPSQKKTSSTETNDGFVIVKTGSQDQQLLAKKGDDLRIDWGYLYVVSPREFSAERKVGARPSRPGMILAYRRSLLDPIHEARTCGPTGGATAGKPPICSKPSASDYRIAQKRCARFRRRADGRPARKPAARNMPSSGAWLIANVSPPANSWPTRTASRSSSAKRTIPTAASAPRTCFIRWRRSFCCSARRWPSRFSCRS